jgi:hypothetical protein
MNIVKSFEDLIQPAQAADKDEGDFTSSNEITSVGCRPLILCDMGLRNVQWEATPI